MRINHNIQAYDSWRNLNQTNLNLSGNLKKLSSGYRINVAADDPAGLAISEKLRSQIGGLEGAIDNSGTAISMIQTAEGAFSEIHNLLSKMRLLAVKSANSGANSDTMLQANQDEIKSSLETITRIAQTTQFGEKYLLNGDNGNTITSVNSYGGLGTNGFRMEESTLTTGVHTINLTDYTDATAEFSAGASSNSGTLYNITTGTIRGLESGSHRITVSEATYNTAVSAEVDLSAGDVVAHTTVVNVFGISVTLFSGSATTITYSVGDEQDLLQKIVSDINGHASLSAVDNGDGTYSVTIDDVNLKGNVTAAYDTFIGLPAAGSISANDSTRMGLADAEAILGTDAKIKLDDGPLYTLSSTSYTGGTDNIHLTTGTGGVVDVAFGSTTLQGEIVSKVYTFDVTGAKAKASLDGNSTLVSVSADVEKTLTSGIENGGTVDFTLRNLAATLGSTTTASIVFTVQDNAMQFQIGANSGQTVKIGVNNVAADQIGTGLTNTSGFDNLNEIDVRSAQGASDAIAIIDKAIDDISAIRSKLGAFQKNTLEANLRNLQISRQNMTASESQIRDVDMAQEMAEFVKNQILAQSGTAMLAQANRMPQSVLQLLGG